MAERVYKDRLFVGAAAVAMGLMLALSSFSITTAHSDRSPKSNPTIAGTAIAVNQDSGEFSTLLAAVTRLGLVETLDGNRQFTVFAPTDQAFMDTLGVTAEDIDEPNETLSDELLLDVVLFHVTRGVRQSQSAIGNKQIKMLNGDFAMTNGATIEGAGIAAPDIRASNGVIHIVDSVLLPN